MTTPEDFAEFVADLARQVDAGEQPAGAAEASIRQFAPKSSVDSNRAVEDFKMALFELGRARSSDDDPPEPIPLPELGDSLSVPGVRDATKAGNAKARAHNAALPKRDRSTRGGRSSELCTDLGNARRIVKLCGGDLRWALALGDLVWDGKRWRRDDTRAADRLAKRAILAIFDEAKSMGESREAESLASFAAKSQKRERIAAALDLARSEPEIAVRAEDLDRDSMLFNVENGTLDTQTGTLRPHARGDLITKVARAKFDPTATAPQFLRFLGRIVPEPEVRAFLQRYFGSALTGRTDDQAFVALYGLGANGKTVLTETIADVLGDYAVVVPFESLTAKREQANAASPDLADLAGARLALATEPAEGARLNVSLVKQLTGGERIKARWLHKNPFQYTPQFKLAMVGNHKPEIPESTHAAWRRVHLVPFGVQIPAGERDPDLKRKLLEERDGILNWLHEGCRAWLAGGLNPPAAVVAATKAYREDEDVLAGFLEDRCILGAAYSARASALYAAYLVFAKAAGEDPVSQKRFGDRLAERGFTKVKKGTVTWFGLGLREPADGSPRDESGGGVAGRLDDPSGFASNSPAEGKEGKDLRIGPDRPIVHGIDFGGGG